LKKCIVVIGLDEAGGGEADGPPAQFRATTSAMTSASMMPPVTGVG
jgi:hypothetical protein